MSFLDVCRNAGDVDPMEDERSLVADVRFWVGKPLVSGSGSDGMGRWQQTQRGDSALASSHAPEPDDAGDGVDAVGHASPLRFDFHDFDDAVSRASYAVGVGSRFRSDGRCVVEKSRRLSCLSQSLDWCDESDFDEFRHGANGWSHARVTGAWCSRLRQESKVTSLIIDELLFTTECSQASTTSG